MGHALAIVERARQRCAQLAFCGGGHPYVADRQLDRVLTEAVETRPAPRRQSLSIDAQLGVALASGPFREIGVVALTRDHQRREQLDVPSAVLAQQPRRDRIGGLWLDRHVAVGAVLDAELDVQQAQEVVDLRQRPDGALAAAAAGALLDRDRGRDAEDRIDVGTGRRLHELPRVGVERLEVPALPLGEHDVEGQRRLAGAGHASDDGELLARDLDVHVAQVVLARLVHDDRLARRRRQALRDIRCVGDAPSPRHNEARALLGVLQERSSGVRRGVSHHRIRRPGGDEPPASLAAFRTEVHDPVGGADHVEIVLDDEQGMPCRKQPLEGAEQLRHVVEMQARRRLVEKEQNGKGDRFIFRPASAIRACRACGK